MGDMDDLRKLHSRVLDRKPVLADLPDTLQYVAKAEPEEPDPVLNWFRDKLTSDDWDRIQAARDEEQRRLDEKIECYDLCRRRDEAGMRSMYPGHASYYDKVVSRPEFEERPVDAVVVIESGAGSLVRKAKKILESGMAREALKVQYGNSVNKYSQRLNTEQFFYGYYTPEIEARMETPRPDCKRLRSSQYTQSACRRDITISIARDWLESRGHRSVRFLFTYQASWPHFELLIEQILSDFDTCIDSYFNKRIPRDTSFLREVCGPQRGSGMWVDYEAYVATLFRTVETG